MIDSYLSGYGVFLFWLLLNLLSVIVYGWDKWVAQRGARRVPEKYLHLLALLGGWPGAWLAQRCFRHKTVKPAFRRIFWLTVVGNLGLILGAARLSARWS